MQLRQTIIVTLLSGLLARCEMVSPPCAVMDSSCNPLVGQVMYSQPAKPTGPTKVLAFTSSFGFYRSDAGGPWEYLNYSGPAAALIDVVGLSDGRLIGSERTAAGVVFESSDGGKTWQGLNTGISYRFERMAWCGGRLLAVAINAGLGQNIAYTSTDGRSWTQAGVVSTPTGSVSDLACGGNTAIVLANPGGPQIIASQNGGLTWANATAPSTNLHALAISSSGVAVVAPFSNTSPTESFSTNSGATFSSGHDFVSFGLSNPAAGTSRMLYTGSFIWGIYKGSPSECHFPYSKTGGSGTWTDAFVACPASTTIPAGLAGTNGIYFGGGSSGSPLMWVSKDSGLTYTTQTLPSGGGDIKSFVEYR